MRLFLALAVMAAGCGNKNAATDDMGTADDLSAAPDLLPPASCSITAQDCGAAFKCAPTQSGMTVVGKCVADGTVDEGQSCMPQMSMTMILDNCKAGLICDNIGTGSNTKFACRKICTADSMCTTAGQKCASVGFQFGWCVPTCAPFMSGGCPTGSDCGTFYDDVSTTMTMENGFFVCKQTGTAGVYGSCMGDSDCAAGLFCDNFSANPTNVCFQLCDGTHTCSPPPADGGINAVACTALANQAGKGYCAQQ